MSRRSRKVRKPMDRAVFLAVLYTCLIITTLVAAFSEGQFRDTWLIILWIFAIAQLAFIPQYSSNQAEVASEVDDNTMTRQHTVYKWGSLVLAVAIVAQGEIGLAVLLVGVSYMISRLMLAIRDGY